jgi:HSP20 family protein
MNNPNWDPLHEMEELLERYGRQRPAASVAHGRSEHLASAEWRPLVDISETAESYLIEAELPGVRREDVRLGIDEGVLTLQGQRHARATDEGRKYHRAERASGRFARSFALPESADCERIAARFEEGLLCISIPKMAERRKRGIEIRIGDD